MLNGIPRRSGYLHSSSPMVSKTRCGKSITRLAVQVINLTRMSHPSNVIHRSGDYSEQLHILLHSRFSTRLCLLSKRYSPNQDVRWSGGDQSVLRLIE